MIGGVIILTRPVPQMRSAGAHAQHTPPTHTTNSWTNSQSTHARTHTRQTKQRGMFNRHHSRTRRHQPPCVPALPQPQLLPSWLLCTLPPAHRPPPPGGQLPLLQPSPRHRSTQAVVVVHHQREAPRRALLLPAGAAPGEAVWSAPDHWCHRSGAGPSTSHHRSPRGGRRSRQPPARMCPQLPAARATP